MPLVNTPHSYISTIVPVPLRTSSTLSELRTQSTDVTRLIQALDRRPSTDSNGFIQHAPGCLAY